MSGRWWPFVGYPMFRLSHRPGHVARLEELRARSCGATPEVWRVEPRAIGYERGRYKGDLAQIARDLPGTEGLRRLMSRSAARWLIPRPCALQVWQWSVPVRRDGVEPAALRTPHWVLIGEWPVGSANPARALARP